MVESMEIDERKESLFQDEWKEERQIKYLENVEYLYTKSYNELS